MKKFEVWISAGFESGEIEADSAEEARRQYAQLVSENIDSSHVEALEIEDDEEEQP